MDQQTRPTRTASVSTYRTDLLCLRIVRAVTAILETGKIVAPIDVLTGMGLLTPSRVDDWRHGRVPYLERVIDGNLSKLSRFLAHPAFPRARHESRTITDGGWRKPSKRSEA